MSLVTCICRHCKKNFTYNRHKNLRKFRIVCKECTIRLKAEYTKKYQLKKIKTMCVVCNKRVYKEMTVHKVCEQRLFNSNAPVTRQWHKEHLNKGVVDDEACVFV